MIGNKNSIMIDLDDPRTGKIADVISNKTSKKILGLLAEKEMSESELAKALGVKLNTIGYNVKKLKEVGLIESVKGFLWSVKGKRVFRYRISNKRIVISPKRMMRGVLPAVLISGILAFGLKIFGVGSGGKGTEDIGELILDRGVVVAESAGGTAVSGGDIVAASVEDSVADFGSGAGAEMILPPQQICDVASSCAAGNIWLWFMFGALSALLILVLYNSFSERRFLKSGK